MTTKPLTPTQETLRDAIVAHYLETGNDCTVKEIATKLQWSESKVRKLLNDAHGFCVEGLRVSEESRTSYSTHYTMFAHGAHRVAVYGPTRAYLRGLLNASLSARKAG